MVKLTDDMKTLLAGRQVYVGTAGADGQPNIAMKGSSQLMDDEHITFFELIGGKTWQNIQKNARVAIVVADWSKMKGYRFEGKVEENITSGPLYDEAKKLADLMKIPFPPKAAVKVKIDEIYDLGKGGMKVS